MSIENIDFSFCELTDKHVPALKRIIKQQFELKEAMKWRLGLRTSKHINIAAVGIKSLNLSHNQFTDGLANELAD